MIFLRNFNDTKKSTKFFRALEFSLLENLGHCRKKNLDFFYNKLTKNEIEFFKKAGLRKGYIFYFFKSKNSNKLRQMLINVFFCKKRRKIF